jgi:hypothetical protein
MSTESEMRQGNVDLSGLITVTAILIFIAMMLCGS